MKPTLLLDGDVLIYRIASSVETPVDWGDDFWTMHADGKLAQERLRAWVDELMETLDADSYVMALSDHTTFRHQINPDYKANRKGKRKPMVIPGMRQYVMDSLHGVCWPLLEADDVVGIMATSANGLPYISVSIDKDFKSFPGMFYNYNQPDLGVQQITPEAADKAFLLQALMGDAVDGYGGCPKLGKVRAARLLDAEGYCWETVVEAYAKAGLGEDYALMMARMARILRKEDWDADNQTVNLWSPEVTA